MRESRGEDLPCSLSPYPLVSLSRISRGDVIMNEKGVERRPSSLPRVSEDWLAVIVGFVLIALVYLSVLARVPW